MSCKTKDRKKRNHKISYESLSSKVYNSLIQGSLTSLLCFETLVLAMHCYCGDNVKYQLLSKHMFQRKQHYGSWKIFNWRQTFIKNTFPLSNAIKSIRQGKLYLYVSTIRCFALLRKSKTTDSALWSVWVFFAFLDNTKQILFIKSEFKFLQADL